MKPAIPELILRPGRVDELDLLREIDDESVPMFAAVGIDLSQLDLDHPFVRSEFERWRAGLQTGHVQVAQIEREVVGFSVLGSLDGKPYLEQLAVRAAFMRRGIGSTLLAHAQRASEGELWLTTYAHVPWNAPYYERAGFRVAPEAECGPEIRAVLAEQRAALPFPEQRVAMVCELHGGLPSRHGAASSG
jgi:GNAT superfamily N-acetyltransferase